MKVLDTWIVITVCTLSVHLAIRNPFWAREAPFVLACALAGFLLAEIVVCP